MTMRNFITTFLSLLIIPFFLTSCDENNNVNIFSVEDDRALGQQVNQEILSDPSFKVLHRETYGEEYAYLDQMFTRILNSGEIAYLSEFDWNITILKDDDMLNAFATPGGYIYIYTGLIKYLNNADALAGVLAHEIAHADLRHTSRTIQKQYGLTILLNVIVGNDATALEQIVAQIAGTAAGLSFSRAYEEEADMKSVAYLASAPYACNGAALFFERLLSEGEGASPPEFFSTHPNPDNRVEDINARADELGCSTQLQGTGYDNFKNGL